MEQATQDHQKREQLFFRRNVDVSYQLRSGTSRKILSEIIAKYPTLPFVSRSLDSPNVRFGVVECVNHSLLDAYPVLVDREGEMVARFKSTVLVMPNGVKQLTGLDMPNAQSDVTIEDAELSALLATTLKVKANAQKPSAMDTSA